MLEKLSGCSRVIQKNCYFKVLLPVLLAIWRNLLGHFTGILLAHYQHLFPKFPPGKNLCSAVLCFWNLMIEPGEIECLVRNISVGSFLRWKEWKKIRLERRISAAAGWGDRWRRWRQILRIHSSLEPYPLVSTSKALCAYFGYFLKKSHWQEELFPTSEKVDRWSLHINAPRKLYLINTNVAAGVWYGNSNQFLMKIITS